MKFSLVALPPVIVSLLCLGSCGGGSNSAPPGSPTPTAATYTIGGTITGLQGSGLVLQNNGANSLTLNSGATSFTFTAPVSAGTAYAVTVLTQPSNPTQSCSLTNATGTANANVSSVQLNCIAASSPTYTIGGTVTGLTGSGLTLQDNGGDNLTISPAQTTFTFATAIVSGGSYSVTVLDQPANPAQTCLVTNGAGTATASVTSVQVTCTTTIASSYTIGGTVTGLTGSGLTLQDNGGDNLTISPGQTTFTFATAIASGGSYSVTVLDQPANPAQNCMVSSGGSGTASANVTTVSIVCTGDWVWLDGADSVDQPGIYGTLGTGAPGNVPGGRYGAISWTDPSGNFWLFGGYGYVSTALGNLNDLWEYRSGQWTWISGSMIENQSGTYGTLGVPSASNMPGARSSGVSWFDSSGNLWLFGGYGFASAGDAASLNDLWKFSAGQWTWVGGSNIGGQFGVYGTKGVPVATNVPGARSEASSWVDKSGNFWLFGGSGLDSIGENASLNDLWRYSAGQWTWMSGANLVDQTGVYGTQGTAAPTNVPGSRSGAAAWVDQSGNLWLFGGQGTDSTGTSGRLNDLWKYSDGEWTWVGGSNTKFDYGVYGVQGVAAVGNFPGSRDNAVSWTDSSGNFWLFGGFGQASSGEFGTGELNDLWQYANGQWTWMSGSNQVDQSSTYGTLGVPNPANVPGGRDSSVGWIDATGNLWLLGGADNNTDDANNDLWEYQR